MAGTCSLMAVRDGDQVNTDENSLEKKVEEASSSSAASLDDDCFIGYKGKWERPAWNMLTKHVKDTTPTAFMISYQP